MTSPAAENLCICAVMKFSVQYYKFTLVRGENSEGLEPDSQSYEQRVWYRLVNIYNIVSFCINGMLLANCFGLEDSHLIFRVLSTISYAVCLTDRCLWAHYLPIIREARQFIKDGQRTSDNPEIDHPTRENSRKTIHYMLFIVIALNSLELIFVMIPSKSMEILFGVDQLRNMFEARVARVLHLFLLSGCFTLVPSGLCFNGVSTALLCAIRAELNIVDFGYGRIMPILSNSHAAEPNQRNYYEDQRFWKSIKQQIRVIAHQHNEVLKAFYKIKQLVEISFFISYLYSIVAWGLLTFAIFRNVSIISIVSMLAFIITNYTCCRMVESLKETNEKLSLTVLELITQIPFSRKHHREYKDVRSTLMLIHQNASYGTVLSCGGFLNIETTVITRLVQTTFTLVTFLFDVN
ncbi:uncharacterized protein LOC129740354 [Uranotaenia lowii]|uniref:uncharacterized protein LOC129740354 n=1 Tax=Uranotaenia lowii TaxID=190385 RepID=UPI00247965EE|nr:uncharacterized protein LOC129740354 [Uranotaenia lowii]